MQSLTSEEITTISRDAKELIRLVAEWIQNQQSLNIEDVYAELERYPDAAGAMLQMINDNEPNLRKHVDFELAIDQLLWYLDGRRPSSRKRSFLCRQFLQLLINTRPDRPWLEVADQGDSRYRSMLNDPDIAATLRGLHAPDVAMLCEHRMNGFEGGRPRRCGSAFEIACLLEELSYVYVDHFENWVPLWHSMPLCFEDRIFWNERASEIVLTCSFEREQARKLLPSKIDIDWLDRRIDYEASFLRFANGLIPEPVRWDLKKDICVAETSKDNAVADGSCDANKPQSIELSSERKKGKSLEVDESRTIVHPEKQIQKTSAKSKKPWNHRGVTVSTAYIDACVQAEKELSLTPWIKTYLARKAGGWSPATESRRMRDNPEKWKEALLTAMNPPEE